MEQPQLAIIGRNSRSDGLRKLQNAFVCMWFTLSIGWETLTFPTSRNAYRIDQSTSALIRYGCSQLLQAGRVSSHRVCRTVRISLAVRVESLAHTPGALR